MSLAELTAFSELEFPRGQRNMKTHVDKRVKQLLEEAGTKESVLGPGPAAAGAG